MDLCRSNEPSNPGNTVAATNLVFDLLMTSNDMHNEYDMHKAIIFIFGGHFGPYEVIRRSNTGFVAATVFPGFLAFN